MATPRLLGLKGASNANVDPFTGMWMSGSYRKPVVQNPKPVNPGELDSWGAPDPTKQRTDAASFVGRKQVAFNLPGSVATAYNITPQNVFDAAGKVTPLVKEGIAGKTAGGTGALYSRLQRFANEDMAQNKDVNASQRELFNQYLKTGTAPTGLDPTVAVRAYDWAYRDTARANLHKKNFFDSFLGKALTIAAEIAVQFIPGVGQVAGAAIAAGIGATSAGLSQQGDALTGAISGAATGFGGQWLKAGGLSSSWSSLTAPANGAGVAATGTNGAVNFATNAVLKGAAAVSNASGATLALTGLSAANTIKGLVGAGAAGFALSTNAPGVPAFPNDSVAGPSPEEKSAELARRRRAAVQTNLTWGNPLLAPTEMARPALLAGNTRLAA